MASLKAKLKNIVQGVLATTHALLLAISTMIILLFIVAVIALLDRIGQANSMLRSFQAGSLVTQAIVYQAYDAEFGWTMVEDADAQGQQQYSMRHSERPIALPLAGSAGMSLPGGFPPAQPAKPAFWRAKAHPEMAAS